MRGYDYTRTHDAYCSAQSQPKRSKMLNNKIVFDWRFHLFEIQEFSRFDFSHFHSVFFQHLGADIQCGPSLE